MRISRIAVPLLLAPLLARPAGAADPAGAPDAPRYATPADEPPMDPALLRQVNDELDAAKLAMRENRLGERAERHGDLQAAFEHYAAAYAAPPGRFLRDKLLGLYARLPEEPEIPEALAESLGPALTLARAKRDALAAESDDDHAAALRDYSVLYAAAEAAERDELWKKIVEHARQLEERPELDDETRREFVHALAFSDRRDYESAVSSLEKVLTRAPWYAEAYFDQAKICAELKQYPKAIALMGRYVELTADPDEARKAKDLIYGWEVAK